MSPRDRDVLEEKHPRASTASGVVRGSIRPESSQAIADPDARAKWRAEQEDAERLAKLEANKDSTAKELAALKADHSALATSHHGLAVEVGEVRGGMAFLVESAKASNTERESRKQAEKEAAERRAAWWRGFFKVLGSLIAAGGTALGIYKSVH